MELTKSFDFDAAHSLPAMPEGHKCRRLHGHTYRVDVTVFGTTDDSGIIIDYGVLAEMVAPVIAMVDHTCLNDLLPNPTTEMLALWFWHELASVPGIIAITVHESATTCCTVRMGA